jgi:hypothetical protein
VGHDLRLHPRERAEFANRNQVRAINEMPMSDGRMLAQDQLRFAIRLFREVTRGSERKTADPVAAADHGMRFEVKQIQTFAESEIIDPAPFFHDQAGRINPGQADAATRVDLVAELFF